MAEVSDMTPREQQRYLEACRIFQELKLAFGGCPPNELRVSGKTNCFYCAECWEAAIKKLGGVS